MTRGVSVAALIAPFVVASGIACSQELPEAKWIEAQQQPDRSAKGQESAHSQVERPPNPAAIAQPGPSPPLKTNADNNSRRGADERSEFWIILGHRTRITDFWLAVFTGLLVLVGAGQTYWLRRTVSEGSKQYAAANRAFVVIDGFNCELTTAADHHIPIEVVLIDPQLDIRRFATQPRWKNGGNTPTNEMTISVNWQAPGGPIPPDYVYRDPPRLLFVAPKAVEPTEFVEMQGAQAIVNHGLNPIGDAPLMIIWGRADYEDVFRHSHFIEWCYRVRFERHRGERLRASFVQWGDHNRTDETRAG